VLFAPYAAVPGIHLYVELFRGAAGFPHAACLPGDSGSHGGRLSESRFPLQNNQMIPADARVRWRQTYIDTNGGTNPASADVQDLLQPATGGLLPCVGTLARRTLPQRTSPIPTRRCSARRCSAPVVPAAPGGWTPATRGPNQRTPDMRNYRMLRTSPG
jgi:hypothetical protein